MAVALTKVNEKVHNDGNKKSILYAVAFTGTYPSGGYTVNNSVLPSAVRAFSKIQRLFWENQINENGYMFVCKRSEIDNSDATNPSFKIRVYHNETATSGVFSEVDTGLTFIQTAYLEVEGIKPDGVDGGVY